MEGRKGEFESKRDGQQEVSCDRRDELSDSGTHQFLRAIFHRVERLLSLPSRVCLFVTDPDATILVTVLAVPTPHNIIVNLPMTILCYYQSQ